LWPIKANNPAILEIGCGPGNITRHLLNQRPDFNILATDIAPNMIKLAKSNCPEAKFEVLDARNIDQLTENYEAIICGFCLPYLSADDTAKLISNAHTLLLTGGLLYLSAIEGTDERSGFETGTTGDETYVYYHQSTTIEKQLKESNFEVVHLIRKIYTKSDGTQDTHLIFIAKK